MCAWRYLILKLRLDARAKDTTDLGRIPNISLVLTEVGSRLHLRWIANFPNGQEQQIPGLGQDASWLRPQIIHDVASGLMPTSSSRRFSSTYVSGGNGPCSNALTFSFRCAGFFVPAIIV